MSTNSLPARVRFAPSPTGHMHLGSARTALYDYLLARQTGGQFILRIEDTDRKRLVPGAEEELIAGLHWLGIDFDEGPGVGGPYGPYRQSERKEIYLEHANQLMERGFAYPCFCLPDRLERVRQEQQKRKESPHYDGLCRAMDRDQAGGRIAAGEKHVFRFKAPQEGKTTVTDLLRGEITVENRVLDDYILVKSDGWALYHLAAAVDDHLMKITHVIRGSEWLPTLPIHSLIHRAFGWEEPVWVHLSIFLKPSGKGKMSKREKADLRSDGYSIFVKDLEELGYLPEAVVNWVALMGWSYDDHTELFSLPDLIEKFNPKHLNPSPAAINFTKLDHFNGVHIRRLSTIDLAERLYPFFDLAGCNPDMDLLMKVTPIIQERIGALDEAVDMAGFFFKDRVDPNPEDLVPKGLSPDQALKAAREALDVLDTLPEITSAAAEPPLRTLVDQLGMNPGQVFGILRAAVTGQKVSPPLFESMEIIGTQVVLQRMRRAVELLEQLQQPG